MIDCFFALLKGCHRFIGKISYGNKYSHEPHERGDYRNASLKVFVTLGCDVVYHADH